MALVACNGRRTAVVSSAMPAQLSVSAMAAAPRSHTRVPTSALVWSRCALLRSSVGGMGGRHEHAAVWKLVFVPRRRGWIRASPAWYWTVSATHRGVVDRCAGVCAEKGLAIFVRCVSSLGMTCAGVLTRVCRRGYADSTVKLGKLAESLVEAEVGTVFVKVGQAGEVLSWPPETLLAHTRARQSRWMSSSWRWKQTRRPRQ